MNLGNWLVLEKWMDSTPFAGSSAEDEVWLHRQLPAQQLREQLHQHRQTYITEEDFENLHQVGIELIRLPVPYFVFGDYGTFPGCIEYVDRAFEWAEQRHMRILLDLHTVPGSQNAFDNGGLSGVAKWHKNENDVLFALGVLERLGKRYGKRPGLYGIEVLNEPASWSVFRANRKRYTAVDSQEAQGSQYVPLRFLVRFYKAAYTRLRRVLGNDKVIVFHDGFRLLAWVRVCATTLRSMHNIALDTHIYASVAEKEIPQWLARVVRLSSWRKKYYRFFFALQRLKMNMIRATGVDVMVGEWCLENNESKEHENYLHEFEELQMQTYQRAGVCAQFMWSYQTEREPKKREKLKTSWKRFWDWRYCHENA
ncbi:glycoside hydrolase family 5 protein [Alloscardovia omnicolens]|uniref:glycoside hydrolase family 5 protein n=1 Tax=Alloscardovia omnicolens TaxID=419015 RepID=UPI003A796924